MVRMTNPRSTLLKALNQTFFRQAFCRTKTKSVLENSSIYSLSSCIRHTLTLKEFTPLLGSQTQLVSHIFHLNHNLLSNVKKFALQKQRSFLKSITSVSSATTECMRSEIISSVAIMNSDRIGNSRKLWNDWIAVLVVLLNLI